MYEAMRVVTGIVGIVVALLSGFQVSMEPRSQSNQNQQAVEPSPSMVIPDSQNQMQSSPTPKIHEAWAPAQVIWVVDGDTIKVSLNGYIETIRIIGIDTPETVNPRSPVQCYGREASNKMKELISEKTVYLEADPSQDDRDRFKRLLRFVFLPDARDVGLSMIADGFAHEYTYNKPYKYQQEYLAAQENARNEKRGLWSGVCEVTASPYNALSLKATKGGLLKVIEDGAHLINFFLLSSHNFFT